MAHTHDVYDTGKRFEINGISRFIMETSQTKLVLVQGDHKSEVVTFEMPRYIDGHDMLLCNKIRVHYINIETKTNNTSADIYEVTDLKLCEDCGEEETLLFTWTIEAPATKYFGSLSFLVKFECTEGDNILYQWNTARYVNVNVLNGIDNSEAFVDKYSNVLEEWYNTLMGESETVANLVETAGQQLEDCEKATTNATKATNSCTEATENCISATADAEAVRQEVEAGGFIESLKEINKGKTFKTWVGTEEEYNEQTNNGTEYEQNCLYITDDAPIADYIMENALAIDANPLTPTIYWTYRRMANGLVEIWGTSEAFKLSIFKYFTINLPLTLKDAPLHIDYGLNLNLSLTETADERSYKGIRVLTRYALNNRINVYFGNDSGETFDKFKFSVKIVGNWK